jgi:hypothetical protein
MSGIALFDEPPRVSIKLDGVGGNGLLLGMASGEGYVGGVVLTEDGTVSLMPLTSFVLDWRYSVETDQWVDVSMPKPEQVDSET